MTFDKLIIDRGLYKVDPLTKSQWAIVDYGIHSPTRYRQTDMGLFLFYFIRRLGLLLLL